MKPIKPNLWIPSFVLIMAGPSALSAVTKRKPPSQEWRNLPLQKWELFKSEPQTPKAGSDIQASSLKLTTSKIFQKVRNYRLHYSVQSEKIAVLGKLIASKNAGQPIHLQDLVLIHSDPEKIQIGSVYTVTQEDPEVLKSPTLDRKALSYPILGRVKILEKVTAGWIARVVEQYDLIEKGQILTEIEPKIELPVPQPGPKEIQGRLLIDHTDSTFSTAQYKEVFIDRGSSDGIQPGMIFRALGAPAVSDNPWKETQSDEDSEKHWVVKADLIVLQTSQTFSLAMVRNSSAILSENAPVLLLTDLSSLHWEHKKSGLEASPPDLLPPPSEAPLPPLPVTPEETPPQKQTQEIPDSEDNALDQLDTQKGLSEREAQELKQLESWNKIPSAPPPSPSPSATLTPVPDPSSNATTSSPAESTPAPMPVTTPAPAVASPPDLPASPVQPSGTSEGKETSEAKEASPPPAPAPNDMGSQDSEGGLESPTDPLLPTEQDTSLTPNTPADAASDPALDS